MEFLLESTKQSLKAQGKPRELWGAMDSKDYEELVGSAGAPRTYVLDERHKFVLFSNWMNGRAM